VPFNTARDGKVILMNPDISNDFLHIYYAGITLPNPAFRVHHNINNQNAYHMYTFEYILAGSGYIEAEACYHIKCNSKKQKNIDFRAAKV